MSTVNIESTHQLNANEASGRRHNHRFARTSGLIAGAIMIAGGTLLMLNNLHITSYYLENWWALFILIPAVSSFAKAWSSYENAGMHTTHEVRNAVVGGTILCLISAMFLFGLNWAIFGPAMLMLIGVSVMINGIGNE